MTRAILWIAFFLAIVYAVPGTSLIGTGVAVVATVLFMWGCGRYAAGKGYPQGGFYSSTANPLAGKTFRTRIAANRTAA